MKERIANNFNDFIEKISEAERTALNTPAGQELTKELLKMQLAQNPQLSPEEWAQTKSEFMTFIFCMFVKETPVAFRELSDHVWEELRKEA